MKPSATGVRSEWDAKLEALPKLDSLDVRNKKVFVRVDMNVPVGREDSSQPIIMDTAKIEQATKTIETLLEEGAAVIVGTHQGRPGSPDFISTEAHAKILSHILENVEVKWTDSVVGKSAREEIKRLQPGEVLFLENLRFHSEENLEADPRELVNTHMIRRLAPLIDAYVNDAFQAAHRSQPSLVAFPLLKPSAAGNLMVTMLKELSEINRIGGKGLFALGGSKLEDKIKVMDAALRKGLVEEILTGGLLGVLIAEAAGYRVPQSASTYRKKEILLPAAKRLLTDFEGRILYPVDFVVLEPSGDVGLAPVYNIPDGATIVDIGPGTVGIYADRVEDADLVVANGPMGVFENPRFRKGTLEFVKACSRARIEAVLCGGHLSVAAKMTGVEGRIYTAGGAILYALAGLPLPAVDALVRKVSSP
ncbi:MAG TPA: phosphoglycerate kinase [Candidatus Korarchaeota archaeon]|nr:phosphoglycerate kinase [Candidatus Korarchaeota archaeon]